MEDIIVLVKFKPSIAQAHLDSLTAMGAEVQRVHSRINWVTVKIPAEKLEELKANPDIETVEEDQEAHALGFNDALVFNLPAAAQTIPYGISKVRAPEVWPEGDRGTGIKVCVIDTGIDYTHPDLQANYKGGHNYITGTSDPKDDNGHGTHVSGIIAALDNDIGVVGVAPEAGIYAYKVLDANGSGSYSNIVSAIDDAITNKMQVISMSLGGSSFSQALKDACDAAYAAGIVLVAAAGNSGGDGSQDTVGYPAKFSESVIAVAATDSNDVRASFSSCGPEVEVAAPGVSVVSTVPTSGTKYSDPSGYKSLSGTSMACPHVSGTVALLLKAHPDFKPVDVRYTLDVTAVHLGDPGRNVFYGAGRIDAKAAVDQTPPPPPPEPVLTTITVSPATASPVVGTTQQFKATALDQTNNPMASVNIEWVVDNSSVGNVQPGSGVTGPDGTTVTTFTASAVGTVKVTASSGTVSGSANVTVVEAPPAPVLTTITILPATANIVVGATQQFKATALDQNNAPMSSVNIAWAVDNPPVGNVMPPSGVTGPDGSTATVFTARAPGAVAVTALSGTVAGHAGVVVTTPPQDKKFRVTPLGVPGHMIGVTVIKLPRGGDKTADEACKQVCDLLKTM